MQRKIKSNQRDMPYVYAVDKYVRQGRVPFHMPGHKQGKGMHPVLKKLWGDRVFLYDLTEVDGLDYVNAPDGVIEKAETLAAEAFHVEHTFFLVNGSTLGNQASLLSAVKEGEEIIVPRNSHQSTYAGLILSGALPVYVYPTQHEASGLYPVVGSKRIADAFTKHPHIKAVHITSPTHCGFTSSIKDIQGIVGRHNATFIVDEAHGSHFTFHPELPYSATTCKADMVVQSTHKTLGSLTQTSMLHLVKTDRISIERMQEILRLLQSSSPSTLFVMSLDAARQQMVVDGKTLLSQALKLARYAREEINKIPGFFCYGKEVIHTYDIDDIDETKLLIDVSHSGYTGVVLEKILGREYKIEIEMSDEHNVLCFVTIGDSEETIERLLNALKSLSKKRSKKKVGTHISFADMFQVPDLVLSPKEAFFAEKKRVSFQKAIGEVSGEFIIPFPPDIPIIAPGERLTKELVAYIAYLKESGTIMIGSKDKTLTTIEVISK